MKKLLFNIYFWLVFVVVTIGGVGVLPVILLVNMLLYSRSFDEGMRRFIRLYGWVLVCVAPFKAPVTVEYRGGKLPETAVYVANHSSAIDPYLFGAIPINNSFVTTWPFKIPVYNLFMRGARYVNATKGWDHVIEECNELLNSGSSITIWPEGHRSRSGDLGRFRNGAFAIATMTGNPIVPVCILGSRKILAPKERLMTPGKVKLIVLPPIYPEQDGNREERVIRLRNKTRETILKTLLEENHFTSA